MAAVAIEYGPNANSVHFAGKKTEHSELTKAVISELCLALQKLYADLHGPELSSGFILNINLFYCYLAKR